MTQTLKENLLYLKNTSPRIFKLIHEPNTDFYPCVRAKAGEYRIPSVDGKFVNSTIDPVSEMLSTWKIHAENCRGKDVVVFGAGLSLHINELLEEKNKNNEIGTVYVVEKNVRLFKTCLGFVNLKKIFPKVVYLLDLDIEDVLETIQKNSKSVYVYNFLPTSRADKEYFEGLSAALGKVFNKGDYLAEYFDKYLKKNPSSIAEVFDEIKKNESLSKQDFKILLLEQIYKKNRKSNANFGN